MELLVDNKNFTLEQPCKNLKSCINQVEKSLAKDRRVIVNIILDGREIYPEDEEELSDFQLSKIEKLEIISSKPKVLVQEGLDFGVKEVFPDAFAVIDQLCAHLRTQKIKETVELFLRLCDYLGWLPTICRNLALTHPQFVESNDGKIMQKKLLDLEAITGEIVKHQENEDWVSLADIIEFELRDILEYFKELFAKLQDLKEELNA
ncbi:hypothetical protein ACFL35_16330 [Candidatus Riflebacteria bacterium]